MLAEMWLFPNGGQIFELSTKCMPSEAFQVAAEARVHLGEHGIDVSGEQQTKRAPPSRSSPASSSSADAARPSP
jgi:hypothetical protein